jgi:precorrin-6B methylase 1
MKDIVITGREMLMLSPNERYSMPDNIADQLIARGKAEEIKPDIVEQIKAEEKKPKKGK